MRKFQMKSNIDSLYGESLAVVFYSYQMASNIKSKLLFIIQEYLDIVNTIFTTYAFNNGKLKKIVKKKNVVKMIFDFMDTHDFNNFFCFQINNDTLDKIHDSCFELYISDFLSDVPNQIYFEFPINSDISDIYSFMKNVCDLIDIEYACCNPIMSYNSLHYPISIAKSSQCALKKSLYNTKYSIYLNDSLLVHLNNHKIGMVNLIQFFSLNFNIEFSKENEIYYERMENYSIISALYLNGEDNEYKVEEFNALPEDILLKRYHSINNILKNIITYDYERDIFFKKDVWNNWIKRFD